MTREALKLALEALQFALHVGFPESSESQIKKGEKAYQQHRAAITAIKEALANEALEKKAENARELGLNYEPDPVAWAHHSTFKNLNSFEQSRYSATLAKKQTNACCIPLYTTPPQRTWVGLTDEEMDAIYEQHHNQYGECESANLGYERAIEAKLKEKNT